VSFYEKSIQIILDQGINTLCGRVLDMFSLSGYFPRSSHNNHKMYRLGACSVQVMSGRFFLTFLLHEVFQLPI
jgi:hypothetical protein